MKKLTILNLISKHGIKRIQIIKHLGKIKINDLSSVKKEFKPEIRIYDNPETLLMQFQYKLIFKRLLFNYDNIDRSEY